MARPVIALLAGATLALAATAPAAARPLILPGAHVDPGGTGRLELVAPGEARACALSFRGEVRREGPYPVRLGGPTRYVRWRVPASARGTWHARFRCRSIARGRLLGRASRRIVVGSRGPARGRLVAPGTLRSQPGSIPEMPLEPVAGAALQLPGTDVDVNFPPYHRFVPCERAGLVKSTRTTGEGIASYIQFEPHLVAHLIDPWAGEHDSRYGQMWGELNRCAHLSADLTTSQRHSLYVQMACHARWSRNRAIGGGNTWDLEAWRNDVDWSVGMSFGGRCGRNYGLVPGAGSYLQGRIVNAFPDPAGEPPPQRRAWLVDNQDGVYVRQHIPSSEIYFCLVDAGKAPARWFPRLFLETYLPEAREVTSDACPHSVAPTPTPAPAPRPSPTPSPAPAPKPTARDLIVVVYGGGHVGVAFEVGWQAGRDPVTCHFFRDGVEVFTAQCGTHSSKQFYGVPPGVHRFHATVSDRFGVYSDPTNVVTRTTS